MPSVIVEHLARQTVLLLDGGLATELEARGCDLGHSLWSAKVLLERPEEILRLHGDYLEAGADCITTASYQATFEGLRGAGLDDRRAGGLFASCVELALEARRRFLASPHAADRLPPLVAVSVGPYGAYLADGSEYRGDYGLTEKELVAFHRRRLRLLASLGGDLLAFETIPSRREARALARLLRETSAEAWLSFSCRDGARISDGSELARVAEELEPVEQIVAIGVNCTAPRHVPSLLRSLRSATGKPMVVYPNSGEEWDAESRQWEPAEEIVDLSEEAATWRALGARLIGGCCRTAPDLIRRLRARLL